MLHFVAGGIVRHDVHSWDKINRICGARVDCAVASNLFFLCACGEHLLAAAEVAVVLSLKPPPLHPTLLLLEFARRPAPQAESARANYNSNVLCSKSLSSAGRIMPGKIFC
jgi:hypothetical protein